MSAENLPAPGTISAVEASAADLILLVDDSSGSSVAIRDTPCLSWVIDAAGVAPASPVCIDSLTAKWALVSITPTSPPELIGYAETYIYVADTPNQWGGSFSGFLTWLQATSGKSINGSGLVDGALVRSFQAWAGQTVWGRQRAG